MEFYTSLRTRKIQIINTMKELDMTEVEEHAFNIDAPDFESALHELHKLVKDVCYQVARYEVLTSSSDFQRAIEVEGKCFGIGLTDRIKLTKEFEDEIKQANKTPDKPILNEESLKNDIEYGINMIRSVVDVKKDVAMFGVINWYYHILLKHFGLLIPTEITEIYDDLRK